MKSRSIRNRAKDQAGFTLIEVMIASIVLVVGLLSIIGLFASAVGNNGRSRIDSTATMLAQSVIEQITAQLVTQGGNQGGPPQITDCLGNAFTVDWEVGGANTTYDPVTNSMVIDFTQTSVPTGYWTNNGTKNGFAVCYGGGGESQTTATYDVRWNITAVDCNPALGSPCTAVVTVGARPLNMTAGRFTFALPVTLRTYVGSEP
jgi:prepilin-type N-terminal cleavage/methylation domain-containing protein